MIAGQKHCNDRGTTQNKPTPCRFIITLALTSLPSVSKTSKSRVMRYCVGATSCQMQFLLGGYSLGHPGLVIEPFSFVMKPPQAAGWGKKRQGSLWKTCIKYRFKFEYCACCTQNKRQKIISQFAPPFSNYQQTNLCYTYTHTIKIMCSFFSRQTGCVDPS